MSRNDSRPAGFLARRFLFSAKSHSIINIMSWVSMVAVGVPVAAMIILMSVFNGFDALVRSMYGDFEPELTVSPVRGKVFDTASVDTAAIVALDGVAAVCYTLDGDALLTYRDRQTTARLRGVSQAYPEVVPIHAMTVRGEYELRRGDMPEIVVGQGVAYRLGVRTGFSFPVSAYVPSRGAYSKLLPQSGVDVAEFVPSGIFSLDAETDGLYSLIPLDEAQRLMDYPSSASGLMIRTTAKADIGAVMSQVASLLPDNLTVQTRQQRNGAMYKVLVYEKWAIFFIAVLILVIAAFSVVGSLVMLIIDKHDNIATLSAVGADLPLIRSVFVRQGMMICLAGSVGGLVLGLLLSGIQQIFGVIRIPADTFLIDAYPVLIKPLDVVAVTLSFVVVSFLIVEFTVRAKLTYKSIR